MSHNRSVLAHTHMMKHSPNAMQPHLIVINDRYYIDWVHSWYACAHFVDAFEVSITNIQYFSFIFTPHIADEDEVEVIFLRFFVNVFRFFYFFLFFIKFFFFFFEIERKVFSSLPKFVPSFIYFFFFQFFLLLLIFFFFIFLDYSHFSIVPLQLTSNIKISNKYYTHVSNTECNQAKEREVKREENKHIESRFKTRSLSCLLSASSSFGRFVCESIFFKKSFSKTRITLILPCINSNFKFIQ